MGVFEDSKLGQLDWMTQMTETIDSDLNDLLSKLPDRIPVTAKDIIDKSGYSYMSISVRDVIHRRIANLITGSLSWEEDRCIERCFAFETSQEPELDLSCDSLSGEITLVKIIQTLSDEDLQPLMGLKGIEAIGRSYDYSAGPHIERMNEILDILGGCTEDMKNRSAKKKIHRIKNRLATIFKTNEWRIRDMVLANKVGVWIRGYIVNGNLADLTNLCKLKVMTHNNMPLYYVKAEK